MSITASARAASSRARQAGGASAAELVELLGEQRGGAGRLAGAGQGLGGAHGQLGEVDVARGAPGRVGEQLEGLLVVVRRLVGAGHRHRLVAGPDAGVERGVEVVGQPGVPGQLGGGAAAHALAERLGVLRVQPHPLAGQQVVVDRLPEQGVPEGVGAVAGDQQVHLDGLPQPLLELGRPPVRTPRRAGRARPCGRRRWPPGPPAGRRR